MTFNHPSIVSLQRQQIKLDILYIPLPSNTFKFLLRIPMHSKPDVVYNPLQQVLGLVLGLLLVGRAQKISQKTSRVIRSTDWVVQLLCSLSSSLHLWSWAQPPFILNSFTNPRCEQLSELSVCINYPNSNKPVLNISPVCPLSMKDHCLLSCIYLYYYCQQKARKHSSKDLNIIWPTRCMFSSVWYQNMQYHVPHWSSVIHHCLKFCMWERQCLFNHSIGCRLPSWM